MNDRFDPSKLDAMLDRLVEECRAALPKIDHIVGIRQGGVFLAQYLNRRLERQQPIGQLDINFYRDDFGHRQHKKAAHPSIDLPDLNDSRVLLVDDVLWTGRTVRAGLNELFDFGRLQQVYLLVLFDRGGHQLPIRADFVGQTIDLADNQQIKLLGDDQSLYVEIATVESNQTQFSDGSVTTHR